MAQPAGFAAQDNRTDMGIPVFWASANLDPPWQFKIWFEQFLMAVTVKENVNPEIILEEPKDILEEPPPSPETPIDGQNEDARNTRILRDKLAIDRVVLEKKRERQEALESDTMFSTRKYKRNWCPGYFCLWVQRERRDSYKRTRMLKYRK